jgi:peroxiredoxin
MKNISSTVKFIVGAVIIFLAAAGGMYLGGKLSGSDDTAAQNQEILTNLTLGPGKEFPDIELINKEYKPEMSRSVLNPNGTVILFMDHQCPPCKDIAQFWQGLINEGAVQKSQVIGICYANAANIKEIHGKYQVDFPVFADERYVFLDYHGVDALPLTMVVGKSGVITYIESDSNARISKDDLKKSLES